LGIDLIPFKTCSYDCIYCQLGRTTVKTIERAEYVPVSDVLQELRRKLEEEPRPDFIGLAGSGEPVLHSRIGDIISGIKALTDVPVAVLTNGSLLWLPEVRAGLAQADLVMPSLDAGTAANFERVNRPHASISFEQMACGLVTFSHEFTGTIWLELLLLANITDCREEVARLAALVSQMRIDRAQLNTAVRPAAEAYALTVAPNRLRQLCALFDCPCEVIADSDCRPPAPSAASAAVADRILELLARRPCTVQGIATGLGMRPNDVLKYLDALSANGAITSERRGTAVFYEGTRNQIPMKRSDRQ